MSDPTERDRRADEAVREETDQDADATMTAPEPDRPDAGASAFDPDGVADSPDVGDTEAAGPV